jgi:hypothetical protein
MSTVFLSSDRESVGMFEVEEACHSNLHCCMLQIKRATARTRTKKAPLSSSDPFKHDANVVYQQVFQRHLSLANCQKIEKINLLNHMIAQMIMYGAGADP